MKVPASWLMNNRTLSTPDLAVVKPHNTMPCEHQTPYVHDDTSSKHKNSKVTTQIEKQIHTARQHHSPQESMHATNQKCIQILTD